MRLKQLLEYQTEINSLIFIHKRPKSKLTEFIIKGYLSFFIIKLKEAIFYKPAGFKGSDKMYSNKVTFMKKDIDIMIDKIDNLVDKFPYLVDGYDFPRVENGMKFIEALNKFFKWVHKTYHKELNLLQQSINEQSLSKRKILFLHEFNKWIQFYNLFLDELETMFSKPVIDPTHNIVFNDDEIDFNKVIKETLSYKLELLDIPENPIMEECSRFIDADYEQL